MPFTADAASAKDGTLIPMGHSIGIKMDLSGVFITNDVMISKDNWLKAGDLIEQVRQCSSQYTSTNFEKASSSIRDKKEIVLHVIRDGETVRSKQMAKR